MRREANSNVPINASETKEKASESTKEKAAESTEEKASEPTKEPALANSSRIGRHFPETIPDQVAYNSLQKNKRRIAWRAFRMQLWVGYRKASAGYFTIMNNWLVQLPAHIRFSAK